MRSTPFLFTFFVFFAASHLLWAKEADELGSFINKVEGHQQASDLDIDAIISQDGLGAVYKGERLFIHPETHYVTVGSQPGAHWTSCEADPSLCVAWPDAESKLTVLDEKKEIRRSEADPATGKSEDLTYVRVRVQYDRKGLHIDREGWVDSRVLSHQQEFELLKELPPEKPTTKTEAVVKTPPCPPNPVKKLIDIAQMGIHDLDNQVAALKSVTGHCPIAKPNPKDQHQGIPKKGNVYDSMILHDIRNKSKKFLEQNRLEKETKNGPVPATIDDLINIDTLARTMFAEMNGCFSAGLQYPMAVAKVALNRVNKCEESNGYRSEFMIERKQATDKPSLSKVLVADQQFSVWNPPHMHGPKDETLLMSLCPTTEAGSKKNWKGESPNRQDVEIWNQSLQIATQAILHPEKFQQITKNITQLDYRSIPAGRRPHAFSGLRLPESPVEVGGRKLNLPSCMQVYNR